MKKLRYLLVLLTILLLIPFGVLAEEGDDPTVDTAAPEKVKVYFFHGDGCGFCQKAQTWFNSIEEVHGYKYELVKYEVWNDADNSALMDKIADFRNDKTDNFGVPYIIIGDKSWNGFTEEWGEDILAQINEVYNTPNDQRYDVMYEYEHAEPKKNTNGVAVAVILVVVVVVTAGIVGFMFSGKSSK